MEIAKGSPSSGSGVARGEDPELTVDRLKEVYLEAANRDVTSLEKELSRILDDVGRWPDACVEMRKVTHDIKGQGASFGYPLMSDVGASLSRLLKNIERIDAPSLTLVVDHVKALRRVLAEDIEGTGGAFGEELAESLLADGSLTDGSQQL